MTKNISWERVDFCAHVFILFTSLPLFSLDMSHYFIPFHPSCEQREINFAS